MPYKDPAKRREYGRKYLREWRKANPERTRAHKRRYDKAHPECARACNRKHYRTPRGRANALARAANRQAKLLGVTGLITGAQLFRLCARYGNRCIACGRNRPLGPDHVKPMSKGGVNKIPNLQPMCVQCNFTKGTKTIDFRNTALARRLREQAKQNLS
jgi:HNH endonuclease